MQKCYTKNMSQKPISKQELRAQMIKIAKDSPSPEPNIVAQKITETQQYKEAQIVICYIALKSEIDISLVADIAIKDNKQVVFVGETPGILNIA
ncbi:MAG: hypothetical protein HUK23_07145, partial [Sphaerochaetaceae bacterium]|nr:hypothetical protein [Sphaerochaetaceae bacterium]